MHFKYQIKVEVCLKFVLPNGLCNLFVNKYYIVLLVFVTYRNNFLKVFNLKFYNIISLIV